MKFKHVIGLDVGTNSLGWSLIKEFEDGTVEIVKSGVHIFPIGTIVDDKSNKEKTRNEQRRQYRGASRMRYRFKLRRKNLKHALENIGMLPDYSKLFKPYSKKEKKKLSLYQRAQSYQLYKLRADAINPRIKIPIEEIGRIFMLLNKYRGFKSNAKKLQKKDSEAGKVETGYKKLQDLIDASNSSTIGEYFFKMHEKASHWYNENKWHNPNEPIDERAFKDDSEEFILFNSNGIRRHHGRYTLRDMYYNEFDKIWAAQKNYYPEILTGSKQEYDSILLLPYKERINALKVFKRTTYWHIREYCIYYQRPLKSQKKYVSNCQFERGFFEVEKKELIENGIAKTKEKRIWKKKAKKACPKSHPLFQEFRIWQKLHQLNYSSIEEGIFQAPLEKEWLPVIVDYLMNNYDILLSKPSKAKQESSYWIGKLLEEKQLLKFGNDYNFFIDKNDEDVVGDDKNENKISGNITYASFKESLGDETFKKLKEETITKTEQLNSEEVIDVKESKLFILWQHLYASKDGLFKEDDWLTCILTEEKKWHFNPVQSANLIAKGLIDDYGSYSSKVLKAILPFMRQGMNEHQALKATERGYVNDDNTVGFKVQLRDKISQLKYQELRNPVVERALSKSIKLVNTILDKYKTEIDKETFEIRIESTRQFRKPRQQRETERRKNADKDKLREQYAAFLTANKGKLGFKKDIYKSDSIVSKYELWLEMNMNEEDDVFISEFKAFSKITKKEDKLKHKLWLECGRRCPYTGKVINFTDCFSSEVEIEHIIPLSRSLDDSFNNKTLTYRQTNVLKGSMTPLEFMERSGKSSVKEFKARINSKNNYHDFSESKMKQFLAEKVPQDFSSNQISNTSYIAKYTRDKMWEVCRRGNVQFTNGSATAELRNQDWKLSNLLDKIRYEEDFQINIDEYYTKYYSIKKDFVEWCRKKYNTSDFKIEWNTISENKDLKKYIEETKNDLNYWFDGIQAFNEFRNKSGKKDRSDHRHHAIDAFITACCSPQIIKELSTYNAAKELTGTDERERIEKPFRYDEIKKSIANILVSHSEKQSLVKKRKNRIKTKEEILEHDTYAPQGSLHKDTFYGKLKRPLHQGYDKKDVYISRNVLLSKNGSSEDYLFESATDLEKVYEPFQKEILLKRLEQNLTDEQGIKLKPFSEKAMSKYPLHSTSPNNEEGKSKNGKPLPLVKSIRVKYKNERSLIPLPDKKFADSDGNYIMAFYEKQEFDKKGGKKKITKSFKLMSFWDAVQFKKENQKLFPDEYNGLSLSPHCSWLKKGDIIYMAEKNELFEEINWTDFNKVSEKLFRINELGFNPTAKGYAVIKLEPHKQMKTSKDKYASAGKFLKLSESINGIKIHLNILGEIAAKGEECF